MPERLDFAYMHRLVKAILNEPYNKPYSKKKWLELTKPPKKKKKAK